MGVFLKLQPQISINSLTVSIKDRWRRCDGSFKNRSGSGRLQDLMVYTPQVCKSVLTSWPPSFYRSPIVAWSCVTCPPVSKATTIPIPKKLSITEINDDRLVALVLEVIKSFKRLLLSHLKAITRPPAGPTAVDDAVSKGMYYILLNLLHQKLGQSHHWRSHTPRSQNV